MRFIALVPALIIALVMAWLTGMWQFALFAVLSLLSGLITTSLMKSKKREQDLDFSDQPLWISGSRVAVGDLLMPRTGFFFKQHFSDLFFEHFTNIANQKEVSKKAEQLEQSFYCAKTTGALPFWCGMSAGSDLEFDLARDGPHALIVGSTGSGKSELLKLLTCSMLAGIDKKLLRLVLIDFKGGAALTEISKHPSSLTLVTDIDGGEHERFWLFLQGELKSRELELAARGKTSITDYPEMPRLVVLADELPAIINSNQFALPTLEAIAARGRSLGVHLIATSQSLSGIPRSLVTNLTLRFALGITDPGDLVALVTSLKPSMISNSRALAICSGRVYEFDFPIVKNLPSLGETKLNLAEAEAWARGLPSEIPGVGSLVGLIEIPQEHQFIELLSQHLESGPTLIIGASGSGKSVATRRLQELGIFALDCPSLKDLESSLERSLLACAVSSSTVLPLAIQRRFENVIYLRQSTLDQHLAAGLPKSQFNEKLLPGRGWYKGRTIQLAMPATHPNLSMEVNEPLPQVG